MSAILTPVLILSGMGLAAGLLLSAADHFMGVKADEKTAMVRECLPGANCGACGFAGCDEYAAKVAAGEAAPNLCIPGGQKAANEISEVLGLAAASVEEMRGMVSCCGTKDTSSYVMDYQGPKSCKACNMFYQGRRSCSTGCLGYGDCVTACKFDAISIQDGLAHIDPDKCTGCGACAKACPNHIIAMVPKKASYCVACSSHDKGAYTRKICSAGCIGCGLCQRNCPAGAITVTDNLAHIDQDKCTGCGLCAEKCPTKCIRKFS